MSTLNTADLVAGKARGIRAELAEMLETQIDSGEGMTADFRDAFYLHLWQLAALHATGSVGGGSNAAVKDLAAIERLLGNGQIKESAPAPVSPAVLERFEKLKQEGKT